MAAWVVGGYRVGPSTRDRLMAAAAHPEDGTLGDAVADLVRLALAVGAGYRASPATAAGVVERAVDDADGGCPRRAAAAFAAAIRAEFSFDEVRAAAARLAAGSAIDHNS